MPYRVTRGYAVWSGWTLWGLGYFDETSYWVGSRRYPL